MQNSSDFYQYLANVVRYHRQKIGLNQAELAKLAKVGKTAVFDIEHAKKTVQLDTLLRVLAVLNIRCELNSPLMKTYHEALHEAR